MTKQKRWQLKNPEKRRAHELVKYHKRVGNLVPEPCEVCGEEKVDAHHDDYSLVLVVRWLCRLHHRAVHNGGAI